MYIVIPTHSESILLVSVFIENKWALSSMQPPFLLGYSHKQMSCILGNEKKERVRLLVLVLVNTSTL